MVTLGSRVATTTLRATGADRMPVGVVYTTFHHPVTGANVVTTELSDWATNCPEYKVTAVEVSRKNAASVPAMAEWPGRDDAPPSAHPPGERDRGAVQAPRSGGRRQGDRRPHPVLLGPAD